MIQRALSHDSFVMCDLLLNICNLPSCSQSRDNDFFFFFLLLVNFCIPCHVTTTNCGRRPLGLLYMCEKKGSIVQWRRWERGWMTRLRWGCVVWGGVMYGVCKETRDNDLDSIGFFLNLLFRFKVGVYQNCVKRPSADDALCSQIELCSFDPKSFLRLFCEGKSVADIKWAEHYR